MQTETFITIRHFYIAIILFAGLILVLISLMLYMMQQKKRKAARQKQLQALFKDWLVNIILQETAEPHHHFEVPEAFRSLLHQPFARKGLLYELLRLKTNLTGQSGSNLVKLYAQLQLANISAHKMRDKRWYRKAKGIQELAVMEQQQYAGEISTLINHRHPIVRMEAQIALVFLQQYEGLRFFENLVYPLTEWHQIKLLQLLAPEPIPSEQIILNWLGSENPSVVQFTLKLIGEQHASHFQPQVIACLSHPDEAVRQQAITYLAEIPSAPAATALRNLYHSESNKSLQMTILTGLMKTGTMHDLPFLQELQTAPDEGIRFAADKTIRHLQEQA